ncbi:unnamed protein product [Diamesa serratosioi]
MIKKFDVILLVLLVGFCNLACAQVQLNCIYDFERFPDQIYRCNLLGVQMFNTNERIIFGGQHRPGRNIMDVVKINIGSSNISFIMPELFSTFPNTEAIEIRRMVLNHFIEPPRPIGVNKVTSMTFSNNEITTINAKVFNGLSNVIELFLFTNSLTNIDENAFYGLENVRLMYFAQTSIKILPPNILHPLRSMKVLFFNDNGIEQIDAQLFANNRELVSIILESNRISSIAPTFMDKLNSLRFINLEGNQCINQRFLIGVNNTINDVQIALQTCFNNYNQ